MKGLVNVQRVLNALFTTAVRRSYPFVTKTDNLVHSSNQHKFGDYQFMAAMQIAQVCVCVYVCACACVCMCVCVCVCVCVVYIYVLYHILLFALYSE